MSPWNRHHRRAAVRWVPRRGYRREGRSRGRRPHRGTRRACRREKGTLRMARQVGLVSLLRSIFGGPRAPGGCLRYKYPSSPLKCENLQSFQRASTRRNFSRRHCPTPTGYYPRRRKGRPSRWTSRGDCPIVIRRDPQRSARSRGCRRRRRSDHARRNGTRATPLGQRVSSFPRATRHPFSTPSHRARSDPPSRPDGPPYDRRDQVSPFRMLRRPLSRVREQQRIRVGSEWRPSHHGRDWVTKVRHWRPRSSSGPRVQRRGSCLARIWNMRQCCVRS